MNLKLLTAFLFLIFLLFGCSQAPNIQEELGNSDKITENANQQPIENPGQVEEGFVVPANQEVIVIDVSDAQSSDLLFPLRIKDYYLKEVSEEQLEGRYEEKGIYSNKDITVTVVFTTKISDSYRATISEREYEIIGDRVFLFSDNEVSWKDSSVDDRAVYVQSSQNLRDLSSNVVLQTFLGRHPPNPFS